MADQWNARFVLTRRVVGAGILAGFLLDILGKSLAVFRAGYPVTFTNIYKYSTRAGHFEVWFISGVVCVIFGSLMVGQAIGALLDNKN